MPRYIISSYVLIDWNLSIHSNVETYSKYCLVYSALIYESNKFEIKIKKKVQGQNLMISYNYYLWTIGWKHQTFKCLNLSINRIKFRSMNHSLTNDVEMKWNIKSSNIRRSVMYRSIEK